MRQSPASTNPRHEQPALYLLPLLAAASGCVASHPHLDSARLLEPGKHEILPYYSVADREREEHRYSPPREDNWLHHYDQIGLIYNLGTSPGTGGQMRVEWTGLGGDDEIFYFGGGPKFAMEEGYAAFSLPIGVVMCRDEDHDDAGGWLQVGPTFIQTIPICRQLEVNLAETAQIYPWWPPVFGGLHLSVGASVGPDIRSLWALRPEFGLLMYPDEERVFSFSLGLSLLPRRTVDTPGIDPIAPLSHNACAEKLN